MKTPLQYPKRLRTITASNYLAENHGVKFAPKTLRNYRALGKGPRWQYLGNVPYTTPDELDRFVEESMANEPANRRRSSTTVEDAEQEAA